MSGRRDAAPAGFSIIELLFAVMILSIGFIAVAAALYGGASSTKRTMDETASASVARAAAATMSRAMTRNNTPETGNGFSTTYASLTLHNAIKAQQIASVDRRFAWVPIYRRPSNSDTAELMIVVVRSDGQEPYSESDLVSFDPNDVNPPALVPRGVNVQLRGDESLVRFSSDTPLDLLAPGALLVINSGAATPESAGLTYQLSEPVDASRQAWSVVPGSDDIPPGTLTTTGYVIGRAYADPRRPDTGYDGVSQVVSRYVTMVPLR